MAFLGADTDELREVGQQFQEGAETVDTIIKFVQALIAILRAASFFSGGASLAYAQYLETTVVPWLQKISMALKAFAQVLNINADAQDEVSNGGTVDYGSLPQYQTPALPQPSQPYDGGAIVGSVPGGVSTDPGSGQFPTGTDSEPGTVAIGTLGVDEDGHLVLMDQTAASAADTTAAPADDTFRAGDRDQQYSHQPLLSDFGGAREEAGAGSGGGSGSGGGAPALGTGSVDSAATSEGSTSSYANPTADGQLGGPTPGAEALGGSGMDGSTVAGETSGAEGPSYAAAAGIAGGAAALGLGGAALAGRGGTGSGGDPQIDQLAGRNGRGSSGEEVRQLQERLTAAGYDTRGADGRWGPNTQAAYEAYRADHPLPVQAGAGYTSPNGYDYNQITGVRGNPNVTPEFLRQVEGMSQRLGARPEHIMAAMSFETGGSFDPGQRNNAGGSATGLIQFMPDTARGLGTTTAELARMTPTEQLAYVERYFEPHRGQLHDLEGVYTSILAGHPANGDESLFRQGTRAYTANAPLDVNRDGVITAAEATSHVRARMGAGN